MPEPNINDVRNFWDARPCNIRHSNAKVGTKEYFNEVEQRKYFVESHIPGFAEFDKWRGKRVLEIGCGIGTDAINFVRSGAEYTGVELSKSSLDLAAKRFDVFGLRGRLMEGNAEEIDQLLAGEDFDLIYSFGVLHHTPNLSKALTSIKNICNNNTIFKFMVYANNSWKNALIESELEQPEAQFGCPIANVYSKHEISDHLKLAGFETIKLTQDHIFPYKIDKYIEYIYEPEEWFKIMPVEIFRALEKKLGWHLLVEAKLSL